MTKIVVDETSDDEDYKAFVNRLPDDDGRYAVYDVKYTLADGGKRNKLVFMLW